MQSRQGGQNHRLLRVGEMLRHALSSTLMRGDLRDPALEGVSVTVSEVRVSPDLRHAQAYVMPLGGQDAEGVIAALNRCAGHLRGEIAGAVRLKYLPRLHFHVDESFDEADRIEALLKDPRVTQDLPPRSGENDED